MRAVTRTAISIFSVLSAAVLLLAAGAAVLLLEPLPLGGYRPLTVVAATAALSLLEAVALYRGFSWLSPLPAGAMPEAGLPRVAHEVRILLEIVFFNPLLFSRLLPAPLMRLLITALGARMGRNSYSVGMIFDPPFVDIGANCMLGSNSMVIPHVLEGARLEHHPISIGDNVTVGAGAIIMAGATVGDGAIIAAGSVIAKFTEVGAGELWEGVPARRLTLADLMERRGLASEHAARSPRSRGASSAGKLLDGARQPGTGRAQAAVAGHERHT